MDKRTRKQKREMEKEINLIFNTADYGMLLKLLYLVAIIKIDIYQT